MIEDVEARRLPFSTLPEVTPGEDSRDSDGLGETERTESESEWFIVGRPGLGDTDRDIGRENVASDLLRILPPAQMLVLGVRAESMACLLELGGGLKPPWGCSPSGPKLCCLETGAAGSMFIVGGGK